MRYLITGGTVFVSKFVAAYFSNKGHDVFVLNRGTKKQIDGVNLIKADRNFLNNCLNRMWFDAIIDVCAYNEADIKNLLAENINFKSYVFISSSAVYPETLSQPFNEKQAVGKNSIWGDYGAHKLAAENYLLSHFPSAYIIRPPYLYGPMQNVYREPFVFDCAELNRKFYIPRHGKMKLQFFYIGDLCKLIEVILEKQPNSHIINAGSNHLVDINTFVELCYQVVGTALEKVYVKNNQNQRDYFSFYNYEYALDVSLLNKILPIQKDLSSGLQASYNWYKNNKSEVAKKPYIKYIDTNFN